MNPLVSLLVGQPLAIMLVAACFVGIYGLWEGLLLLLTPEANIRVGLLVIWPGLALVSLWSLLRVSRSFR